MPTSSSGKRGTGRRETKAGDAVTPLGAPAERPGVGGAQASVQPTRSGRRRRAGPGTVGQPAATREPQLVPGPVAFGGPGSDPLWAPGGKDAIGTCLTPQSPVWFTLAQGVVTEVYYPRVDLANSRDLQFLLVGDAPEACHAAGVRVRLGRSMCLLFAGTCAGAAGAYLSIMQTHAFAADMTGGEGFVVLALVIFGRWKLPGLVGGCLFFGLINSLQQTLQTARYTSQNSVLHALTHVPFQFFQMLPYLAAIAALAVMSRNSPGPRYINIPWPSAKT